ncbi:hypothetical protein ACVFVO_15705 [Advenella kashmirensis]
MQKFVAISAILIALSGCGVYQGHYTGAPPMPADAPPPTSLMAQ